MGFRPTGVPEASKTKKKPEIESLEARTVHHHGREGHGGASDPGASE